MSSDTDYDAARFDKVDEHGDPAAFVRFMDNTRRRAAQYKETVVGLLELRPGDSVLDVGCGTGDDVLVVAEIVGERGRTVGVDVSETMIAEARKRSQGSHFPIEFRLGNKNARMLPVFESDPSAHALVAQALAEPSLYDEFLRLLARAGYGIPASVLDRDVTRAWVFTPELVPVLAGIYRDAEANWAAYESCEELVDLEDNFQLWRFRHMKTVERIIGFKTGTCGSSGVPFLRRALELTFFPELYAVRTEIGT